MAETLDGKRRHPRRLAAWPAWVKLHHSAKYLKGTTRNVSRGGAFIVVPMVEGLAAGEEVEYILGVPASEGDSFAIQAVDGQAQVVRVERGAEGGLALSFTEEQEFC